MLDSVAQSATVLRDELASSSRFLRLSAIQSLTVALTVCGCGRFGDAMLGRSGVDCRLIILITILLSLRGMSVLRSVKKPKMASLSRSQVHESSVILRRLNTIVRVLSHIRVS